MIGAFALANVSNLESQETTFHSVCVDDCGKCGNKDCKGSCDKKKECSKDKKECSKDKKACCKKDDKKSCDKDKKKACCEKGDKKDCHKKETTETESKDDVSEE